MELEVDEIVAVGGVVVVVQVDVLEVLVLVFAEQLVKMFDVYVVVDDVEELVLVDVDAVVEKLVDDV